MNRYFANYKSEEEEEYEDPFGDSPLEFLDEEDDEINEPKPEIIEFDDDDYDERDLETDFPLDLSSKHLMTLKRGREDLFMKRNDWSKIELSEPEDESKMEMEDRDPEDEENYMDEFTNPFFQMDDLSMMAITDEDYGKFQTMIKALKYPEDSGSFIGMAVCWIIGLGIGFAKPLKWFHRMDARGYNRLKHMKELTLPSIKKWSDIGLLTGAAFAYPHFLLNLVFDPSEYNLVVGAGVSAYFFNRSAFRKEWRSPWAITSVWAVFSLSIIGFFELRRISNGFYGPDALTTLLQWTTHNPVIRYLLDVQLGITKWYKPNFYGKHSEMEILREGKPIDVESSPEVMGEVTPLENDNKVVL